MHIDVHNIENLFINSIIMTMVLKTKKTILKKLYKIKTQENIVKCFLQIFCQSVKIKMGFKAKF